MRDSSMKPFNTFPTTAAQQLQYILFDIDDTITTEGLLTYAAYKALWDLYGHGFTVIPVTGRPAGWCDMIIRQWPVDAVVGENGAFAFYKKSREPLAGYQVLTHPNVHEDAQQKLVHLRGACLAQVSGCRVAKDQFARRYDLAIDFCEDEPDLGLEAAYQIRDICEAMGAVAKVSSIHVNAWFGAYDKLSMADMLLTRVFKDAEYKNKSLFFGDSPNDEPMFGFFPHSCAVANILPFLDKLNKKPAYISEAESGLGFAQSISHLLELTPKRSQPTALV